MSQHQTTDVIHANSRFAQCPRSLCSWGLLASGLGVCSGTAMVSLKLLREGTFSTHLVWGGLVAMLLGAGLIASGFVMLAEWQDPFAGDGSLPEVRTFPEDFDGSELNELEPQSPSSWTADSERSPSPLHRLESCRT